MKGCRRGVIDKSHVRHIKHRFTRQWPGVVGRCVKVSLIRQDELPFGRHGRFSFFGECLLGWVVVPGGRGQALDGRYRQSSEVIAVRQRICAVSDVNDAGGSINTLLSSSTISLIPHLRLAAVLATRPQQAGFLALNAASWTTGRVIGGGKVA